MIGSSTRIDNTRNGTAVVHQKDSKRNKGGAAVRDKGMTKAKFSEERTAGIKDWNTRVKWSISGEEPQKAPKYGPERPEEVGRKTRATVGREKRTLKGALRPP